MFNVFVAWNMGGVQGKKKARKSLIDNIFSRR
jgi:hypothetical protein